MINFIYKYVAIFAIGLLFTFVITIIGAIDDTMGALSNIIQLSAMFIALFLGIVIIIGFFQNCDCSGFPD